MLLGYLHHKKVYLKNLHPDNIFINKNNHSDFKVAHVGFADIPGVPQGEDENFIAPELKNVNDQMEVSKIV